MEGGPSIDTKSNLHAEKPKTFLYHRVPEGMRGNVLYPLNALKGVHTDLYVHEAGKYRGREHIMEQFLPTLEAAWNDVLHFTAVDPHELKQALIDAGMEPKEMKFYQVDPALLDPSSATIYLYQDKSSDSKMSPDNFLEFNPDALEQHATLPEETRVYYKRMFAEGGKPLLFLGVPHILHKGPLDVSSLPIITV